MWFDGVRQPDTLYVASVSRGKDSTAMLRAIQLMGWPLDAIYSVDIWFDDDTPAELPPMVAFKAEWDAKCLEWFGVPVTRLCATKRERERVQTPETVTHERRTQAISTAGAETDNLEERSSASQCNAEAGARSSNTSKLTYVDIFYRKVSPERGREDCPSDVSHKSRGTGATRTSNARPLRLPDYEPQPRKMVYRPQNSANIIKGFPWRKGAWCQDRLKGNNLDRVFFRAPGQGAENKYCPLHWNCRRRAGAHSAPYAEERQGYATCPDRMG